MQLSNPVDSLHRAIAHACYTAFPDVMHEGDITVEAMFPQTWASTAMGFGGIGGSAMTTAYTIVIRNELTGMYAVYFGGRFAYMIERPTQKFFQDVAARNMHSVSGPKEEYENERKNS